MIAKIHERVQNYVDHLYREINHPHNDGFMTWEMKKKLYEIIYYVEEKLDTCPTYGTTESEYLEDIHMQKAMRKLGAEEVD